jgi:hypothetical protein
VTDLAYVTHQECEKHREKIQESVCDSICKERNERINETEKLEAWLLRIEEKMDGTNSRLSMIAIELLIAFSGVMLAFLLGRI